MNTKIDLLFFINYMLGETPTYEELKKTAEKMTAKEIWQTLHRMQRREKQELKNKIKA